MRINDSTIQLIRIWQRWAEVIARLTWLRIFEYFLGEIVSTEYKFSFEKLTVWQNARKLTINLYKVTETFPTEERYCLTSQIRRAIISAASNLAEGSSRTTSKDQAHFTNLAYSSLMEVLNQLFISLDQNYISEETFLELKKNISEIANQLNALRKSQLHG